MYNNNNIVKIKKEKKLKIEKKKKACIIDLTKVKRIKNRGYKINTIR